MKLTRYPRWLAAARRGFAFWLGDPFASAVDCGLKSGVKPPHSKAAPPRKPSRVIGGSPDSAVGIVD